MIEYKYNPADIFILTFSFLSLLFSIFHHFHYTDHTSQFTGNWINSDKTVSDYRGPMVASPGNKRTYGSGDTGYQV